MMRIIHSFLKIGILVSVFFIFGCADWAENTIIECIKGAEPILLDESYKFNGDLIFRSNEKGEIIAFNGETHKITPLFYVNDGDFWDVSPLSWDGKNLVLSSYPNNVSTDGVLSLSLMSYDGNIKQINIPIITPDSKITYSWASSEWINEEHLQSILVKRDNEGKAISEVLLLNPFNPRVQKFSDFVKIESQGDGEDGFLVSPDLTRVLFINSQYYLTLYDVVLQKELWTYEKDDGAMMALETSSLGDTVWSKTSDMLFVPVPSVTDTGDGTLILFVSRDGEIVNSIGFENYQHGFSWDSNENLLAFYGYECSGINCPVDEIKSVIQVLNADTNTIIDLCSLGNEIEPTSANATGRIVWSPNDTALVFSSFSIRSAPGTFLIKKLDDPNLISIPIDPYRYTLLGWSPYHWNKTGQ